MKILGIETSCDETAVAIIENGNIISDIVYSQSALHRMYGGVVPEMASREHLKKLNLIIETALKKGNLNFKSLDAVAVTSSPGLEGSLLVGRVVAKSIAFLLGIKLIEIDHLEAHLFAKVFSAPGPTPGIGLIISGGHTRLIYIKQWGDYKILGTTKDDAVGEAFDKVASMLNLSYPGGPSIEKTAKTGDPLKYKFPVSKFSDKSRKYDFSYSGIKTAVLYKIKYDLKGKLSEEEKRNIAASFQHTAFKPLIDNSIKAAKEYNVDWIFVAGGVASNQKLRELFVQRIQSEKFKVVFPDRNLCTDNASTVAACGEFYLQSLNR